MVTTIQLDEKVKGKLDFLKIHPRETYNELLIRLVENCSAENDKEVLVETLEIISDPETMHELADAVSNLGNPKKWTDWEDMKKRLNLNVQN